MTLGKEKQIKYYCFARQTYDTHNPKQVKTKSFKNENYEPTKTAIIYKLSSCIDLTSFYMHMTGLNVDVVINGWYGCHIP